MLGQITKFRDDIGVGVIAAEDGHKYRFARTEVINRDAHLIGQEVDFLVDARRPHQIIMLSGSPWTVFGDFVRRAANDQE